MILNSPYISGSLTVTGNTNLMGALTVTGSLAGTATSSSFAYTASSAVSAYTASSAVNATTALTASYANTFTVGGTLTAQTLVVQTITSSVSYITGSTRFGSTLSNTHTFTGSLQVTGSGPHYIYGNTILGGTSDLGSEAGTTHAIIQNNTLTNSRGLAFYANDGVQNPRTWILHSTTSGTQQLQFNSNWSSATGYASFAFLNGYVGIGTTAPSNPFTVMGTGAIAMYTGSNISVRINSTQLGEGYFHVTSAGVNTMYAGSQGSWEGNNGMDGAIGSVNNLKFYTSGSATPKMVISTTGNFGIGTVSPAAKLDVSLGTSGSVYVKGTSYTQALLSTWYTNGSSGANPVNNFSIQHQQAVGQDHAWTFRTEDAYKLRLSFSNQTNWVSYTDVLTFTSAGIAYIAGTSQLGSATLSTFGSIAARNGGVDGTYAEAFTAYYSGNNTESNAILTAVSTTAANSGFRFAVSNGAGSAARTNMMDITRSGVKFQNGASYLNYYEEGTWTPVFGGAGSPSYTTQVGKYTRVGRIVYCTIALRATSVSSASTISISGLPFSPADASDTAQRSTYSPRLGGHINGVTETTAKFRVTGGTSLDGVKGDGTTTYMTATEFTSGGSVQITGDFWYYV